MKSLKYSYRIIVLLFLVIISVPVEAQNNPYKIDDFLFPIYQRATKYRTRPQGLLIADTLYSEAVEKHDKKAQCLALTIPVLYYYTTRADYKVLEQATNKLKEVSRKNDYLQYYYFACSYEINYLLVNGRSLAALQKAEEIKKQAFKDQHMYGIYSCIRIIGNIYQERNNTDLAAKHYKNALEYMVEYLPEQDPSPLYLKLAQYYRSKKEYELGLEYIEKAIKEAKTEENKISAMLEKCQVLWGLEREDEFKDYYNVCIQMVRHHGIIQKGTLERLRIYSLILDGKYAEAHRLTDSIKPRIESLRLHESIYLRTEDYENAYYIQALQRAYKDSIEREVQSDDLAELNVQIGNERIKLEKQALALENAELNAENAKMELRQTKSQMELERMNAENNRLVLNNKNLELARLKIDAERQKAILKEQQAISQHHIITLSLVISFLLLFAGFLIFYLYKRRKTMAHLQQKNDELLVARDQAEQADRMKTFFIQNMSHEIRTPLNAIVGFSQLLFDSNMLLGEKDKQEFSILIQQNSELLTTLINDILDLANLESGKYTMNIDSHSCNELCRMAVSTVYHRKPEFVKLYFTSEVEDDFQINTDANRFRQVLINFLTNAEKYTTEGEIHLHCSLSENAGKVTFAVSDTGIGIPENKAETIFERFKKLDEFKQGTGLGLNICRIIADRLGGEVRLDRNYTNGARFLFIVPT